MKAFQLLALFSFSIALFNTVLADISTYTSLCRLFKNKTKFRVPGSCDEYIECNGQNGKVISCGTNLQYNQQLEKCVKDLDNTQLCENRCKGKNGKFVANPIDCRAFYYCDKGQAFASFCGMEYYFDEKNQMCVYPNYSSCVQDVVNNVCELVKDGTVFRDENDCSKYYKCSKNQQTKVECTNKYFNVETGKCDDKKNVQCDSHPATPTTCLDIKKNILKGKISDGVTCRGYFYCADKGEHAHDLQPIWLQCPVGTFFNDETKNCEDYLEVKCEYDRCEGHGNSLSTSGKNNCRNYLVCKDNRTVEEKACAIDYFFDEKLQACVNNIVYYKSCDQPKTHS